jgi:hypothetical protein
MSRAGASGIASFSRIVARLPPVSHCDSLLENQHESSRNPAI